MKITCKQIEVFVAIAKAGNMTQASTELFLTQSACSMALTLFEEQLGGKLFDRYGKRLILNERGRELLPKATNILTQLIELQNTMGGKGIHGKLKIGASDTIGSYLLPNIISNYLKDFPLVKVSLDISNTATVIQQLLKFDIDIGFIEGDCYSEDIDVIPWNRDQLIIIAPAKHTLAKNRKINPKMLCGANWILREAGSGTRIKFEEAMQKMDIKIKPYIELGNTESIKQTVLTGLGISCLSKIAVRDLLEAKKLVELKLPDLKLTRNFYMLMHKDKYKTPLLENFLKYSAS